MRISKRDSFKFRIKFVLILIQACILFPKAQSPSHSDSGWVSIFNNKDLNDFFVYVGFKGYADVHTLNTFSVLNGMIKGDGPYALLLTKKEYSHYRLHVDYMFDAGAGELANAGVIILVDHAAAIIPNTVQRPRSIEINCRRDHLYPATLWSAYQLGPYITSSVQPNTQNFLPQNKGGVSWTNEPWDPNIRVVQSALTLSENPPGQWNAMDISVFGDSVSVSLNGSLRTQGWHFQIRGTPQDSIPAHRIKVSSGSIALQSEGDLVWYKNWEVMELDSVTNTSLNATRGCTDKSKAAYNIHAVMDDGSCNGISIRNSHSKMSTRKNSAQERTFENSRNLNGRRIFITKKPALNYSEQALLH